MKPTIITQPFIALLLIIIILSTFSVNAQETVVVGQITNRVDKSPIPNVNIYFKNTNKGVQSNEEGYFLIRANENQTVLVFSAVGFKKREIRVKAGQSVGAEIELDEENTLLQEVFIIPGANPALEILKKVRFLKSNNDASRSPDYLVKSTEQYLVLLSKVSQRTLGKKLFEQLQNGSLSKIDTALTVPLYMSENSYIINAVNKKQLTKNIFNTPEFGEKTIEKLIGEIDVKLNFYENTITVFGKGMLSPLANTGNGYYNYYLTDSLKTETSKQYKISFVSKNSKNLAFNGFMWIDSASYALTALEAELPLQANINFIENLHISQKFSTTTNHRWILQSEQMALSMKYELLADSLHSKPTILVKRSANFQLSDSTIMKTNHFAESNFSEQTLNKKLEDLNETPIMQTVKWLADIILTGYIPYGKIDIGKIQQIIRISDIEGLRLTMPLRTNEKLWKNLSIGGYVGYGFKNKIPKYCAEAHFKIPGDKRRIIGLNYSNDFRRIDYNYKDFLFSENPLQWSDEDISSTVFAFRSANKMSERHEYSISISNEWNTDVESNIYLRSNTLFANNLLTMQLNATSAASFLQQQSATLSTRISFNEKSYDDHMQRIYIANKKPVIYGILEVGEYNLSNQSGKYGKIIASMKQLVNIGFAELNYNAQAGIILGKVPYPLLEIASGNESGGYSTYKFNMMNYMEYASDKYLQLHSELTFNGQFLNQIPVIKHLNLREMCSFNIAYGNLSNTHKTVLDYPAYLHPLTKPYMEVGVGFSNIFKLFTLQSVWRLTDLGRPGVSPWGLRGCLRIRF